MRNIKLADLFACDEGGMMVVAEDRQTGLPVRITAATQGLKCDCLCPVCRRPLIARKGSRRHSFAHYPQDVQRSCVVAGESLLHRFAKDVLAREKYIMRPEITARDELGVLQLKPPGKVAFDRVELELEQVDVVPDVVCYLGDRRLFVEFKVTHAVDEAKLRKLRRHDASVMEIDLSAYREYDLEQLPMAILVEAPRVMLLSEIFDRAPQLLARRQERRLAGLKAQAEPYLQAFNRQESLLDVSNELWFGDAVRHSIPALIVEKTYGEEPFRVKSDHWRTWVLWQLLATQRGWTARHLAYEMLKSKWVKRDLYNPAEAICKFIRSDSQPIFRSATEAVQEFLEELKKQEKVHVNRGGRWFFANGLLRRWFEERCRELTVPNERRDNLERFVDSIVKVLPHNGRRHFRFDDWLEGRAVANKVTVDELLSPTARYYDEMWEELTGLRRAMSAVHPEADLDMIGLPLGPYFLQKQEQLQARERALKQEALIAAIKRADKLVSYVRSFRSANVDQWLFRSIEYDGRLGIPVEHASRSPQAAAEMHRLFEDERKRREDEA
ncbi:hypothetical protein ABIA24_000907 [Sinorhizobium fredii]|uniref:hypothetical protein n=1 Tax=Rhizobium fredii TaxID=380 RepID=UPI003519A04D